VWVVLFRISAKVTDENNGNIKIATFVPEFRNRNLPMMEINLYDCVITVSSLFLPVCVLH
jgi:hypothetical protein